ncbi:MAG: LptF/LptG family permease [candidate division FCPU426 bacterium]
MRLLSRYILKELRFPFAVSLFLFTFLMIMNKILTLIDLVLKHGVGLWVVGKLIACILPTTLAVTLPMSLLVAVLVALGRLSADMELVAIRAGAVGLIRLFVPLVGVGLAFSAGMLAFNETALPRANLGYKALFHDIISKRSSVAIQENTYVSDFEGMILHVSSKDQDSDILRDLTVIKLAKKKGKDKGDDAEPMQWIQARWGRLVSDKASYRVYLELHEGTAQFLGSADSSELTTLSFQGSTVDLDIEGSLGQVQGKDRMPQEMTVREIWSALDALPLDDHRRFNLGVEMHKKIAIPFACLSFILIAFPLGLSVRKGGRMLGFSMALGLIFAYYLLISLGQTYGDDGRMPAWMAMWLANLVLAGIGLPLSYFVLNEKRLWPRNAS